jgi:hypothetical protein
MEQIAPGIHRWTMPHPEYRTTAEEVVCYALAADEALVLVDPLLPPDTDARRAPLLAALDELARPAHRLEIAITIPYHTRSAESLYERYAQTLPTRIWGHANVKSRLTRGAPLERIPEVVAGQAAEIADGAISAYTIGKPRRSEHPLYVPALAAVAFGDAVVGTAEGLRLWRQSAAGPEWYRDVFVPTLAPLLDLPLAHVLVTHGPAAAGDGRGALAACLAADPVDMY